MIEAYKNHFNNNINLQTELTCSFLPLIKSIDTAKLIKYLTVYYYLGSNRNLERGETIARIDQMFEEENLMAQADYDLKKEKRKAIRTRVLYGIGSAIGLILVITMILLLFSIQQYLKMIGTRLVRERKEDMSDKKNDIARNE